MEMDDQQLGLNKRQRLSADEQEQTVATEITDLNNDCLEKVFGHLDCRSLFNVAVSNKWLRPAACSVYGRQFGRHKIAFDIGRSSGPDIQQGQQKIYVWSLKTSLQFVRCFGPLITNIQIASYSLRGAAHVHLQQYINEYCAESLVHIEYRNIPNFSAEFFQKPFTNVQSVQMYNVNFGNQLQLFTKWFPNLRRLWLSEISVGRRFVATTFPYLEHLRIEISRRYLARGGFSKENVADLLRLNPQLQSLIVDMLHRQGITLTSSLNIAINNLAPEIVVF